MKQEILEELKHLKDEKYQEFHSNLCPGINNIIGVRVPILRNYAKELIKRNSLNDLLDNIGNNYYEEIMLQGMLIGLDKNKDIEVAQDYIENFVPKIDNWAICDVFCAGLKMTKKHKKEMWNFIQNYIKSDKEFEVRFAIVMILDYYIEEDYLKEIFKIFNQIQLEKYYVQMAVAWAISVCLIKYYEETIEFLKKDSCKLDVFTYNKSIQKAIESYRISDERKQELRKMKK